MSDISDDLLTAYKTDLETQKGVGGALTWVHHYAVPGETNLSKWYGLLPLVLIIPEEDIYTPDCLEGTWVSDQVVYRIKLACIIQAYDQSYGTHSPSVPDYIKAVEYKSDLKSRYNRRTFDLSQSCVITNVRYGASSIPGLNINNLVWGWGVELTFEHDWIDREIV